MSYRIEQALTKLAKSQEVVKVELEKFDKTLTMISDAVTSTVDNVKAFPKYIPNERQKVSS